MALNLSIVVQASLRLLDDEGLDSVTTRRISQVLGVTSPALYRHVRSKQELFGHMIAAILEEGMLLMRPCDTWQDWLGEYARTYRAALLAHRDSVRMLLLAAPSERTRTELVPAIYRPLVAWGLAEPDAITAEGVVASFVLGWVGHEQNEILRSILEQTFELEATFEQSVATIIAGIEQRMVP